MSDLLKELFVRPNKEPKLYIYYKGQNIDTIKKIQKFVEGMDRTFIQINVVDCPMSVLKELQFKGVLVTDAEPKNWKDLCASSTAICTQIYDDSDFEILLFELATTPIIAR